MSIPLSQIGSVVSYVLKQKVRGKKRYPLVLMLEPLLRCNLSCAGCGKTQYPGHILKKEMSLEQVFNAIDECQTPIVSICGGEPLLHSQIDQMVQGLMERKKYIYLCTNGLLLKKKIELFKPSKYLTFSIHLDGDQEAHDFSVCREGVYVKAEEAIRLALQKGFRVTTNTTLYEHADIPRTRQFFDHLMDLGLESMMLSPGYNYSKAPNQKLFLNRKRTLGLFQNLLKKAKKSWRFNHSPLYLEFLTGQRHFECMPWGNPCYTLFGWQKPCYLLQEGYAASYEALLQETAWRNYGYSSGNPQCQQCLTHCGYEPAAVDFTFSSLRGLWATTRAYLFGLRNRGNSGPLLEVTPVLNANPLASKQMTTSENDKILQEAIDFRGDVKISLKKGSILVGFLFNKTDVSVDFYPNNALESMSILRSDIAHIEKTDKDWADGQSWKSWIKRYQLKPETSSL